MKKKLGLEFKNGLVYYRKTQCYFTPYNYFLAFYNELSNKFNSEDLEDLFLTSTLVSTLTSTLTSPFDLIKPIETFLQSSEINVENARPDLIEIIRKLTEYIYPYNQKPIRFRLSIEAILKMEGLGLLYWL